MIELKCPHCASQLKIEGHFAGQSGRCNKCGGGIVVPARNIELDDPDSAFNDHASPRRAEKSGNNLKKTAQQLATVGKSMLACGCLMPIFLFGLFVLIAVFSPSEPDPFESEKSAVANSIDANGLSRSTVGYRVVLIQEGVGVMTPFEGAYWVKDGIVHHANGFAKMYSSATSRAPVGIGYREIEAALNKPRS